MTKSDILSKANFLIVSALIRHTPKELQQSLVKALEEIRPKLAADPTMIAALEVAIQHIDSIRASDEAPPNMRDILKVIHGGKSDS